MSEAAASRGKVYGRDTLEFSRVIAFSDGIFAIAMTLLVVGIGVPTIESSGSVKQLAEALGDNAEAYVSFFISFIVIGRYWMAHHRFISFLGAMDPRIIGLSLVYLAFIAFLPFPTDLLGNYFENPLSVTVYAVTLGIVSGMEVVLFRHAYRNGLLDLELPDDVYRFEIRMSSAPVVFFAISIPVAFGIGSGLAVACWFLGLPYALLTRKSKPRGADQLLGG